MKNDFLDYNGLYSSPNLSHSSGPWKKHKYIKKINGVYYYGDKTELGQIKNKTDNAAKNKDKQNKLASQVDLLASKSEKAANKLTKAKQKNQNSSNIITNVAESLAKNKYDKTNNAYEEKSKELKERVLSNYEDEKFVNDRTVKKQVSDKVNNVKKNVKNVIDREKNGMAKSDFDFKYDVLQEKAREKSNKAVDNLGEHLFDDGFDEALKKRDEAWAEEDRLRENRSAEEKKSVSKTKTAAVKFNTARLNAEDAIKDKADDVAYRVGNAVDDVKYTAGKVKDKVKDKIDDVAWEVSYHVGEPIYNEIHGKSIQDQKEIVSKAKTKMEEAEKKWHENPTSNELNNWLNAKGDYERENLKLRLGETSNAKSAARTISDNTKDAYNKLKNAVSNKKTSSTPKLSSPNEKIITENIITENIIPEKIIKEDIIPETYIKDTPITDKKEDKTSKAKKALDYLKKKVKK